MLLTPLSSLDEDREPLHVVRKPTPEQEDGSLNRFGNFETVQRAGQGDQRSLQDRSRSPVGPLHRLEAVELATLEWVDWLHHRCLSPPRGMCPQQN